ncbi:MAG: putative exported protein [Acidobacteria bacterium]|nr:putative exported protein [Acidobacteriota bacterium]
MSRACRSAFTCRTASLVAACAWALLAGLAAPALAQEDGEDAAASAEVTLDVGTNYVWRGLRLSSGVVSQFAANAWFKGVSLGLWSNYDPNEYPKDSGSRKRITETDLTASYSHAWGRGTLTGGLIYYGLHGAPDTTELLVGYGLTAPLNPAATLYVDVGEGDGAFLLLEASHSLAVSERVPLDVGAEAGFDMNNKVMGTDEEGRGFTGFYHAELWAETSVGLGRGFAVAGRLAVSFPLGTRAGDMIASSSYDGATRTCVYGSVGITAGF